MKNKKIKVWATLAATFLASVCASVGVMASKAGAENTLGEATLVGGALEEKYLLGGYVSIPSAQLTCGGKTEEARIIVKKPNGELVQTNNVSLTEGGIYTVEYRADFNGTVKTVEKSFLVETPLFSVRSKNSSAVYGEDKSQYQTGIKGINVELAEGDVLTYNDVIDLNASDGDFLEFILPPTDGAGTADLRKLVVTLTDLHDENISLTVVLQCPVNEGGADTWYYDYTYVQAGGQNQTPTGVEGNKVHAGNDWGAPTRFSFYGMHGQNVAVGNERLQLTYKQDSNMVVANGTKVVSLDDLSVFENAWKGFTTGEVKMTIQGGKYNRPYASMLITKIGVNNLSQVILEDDEAPEITVDYNGLDPKDIPTASKGLSYPVFNATAMDKGSGVLPVQTTVYYSYNSQQRYQLEVVDGRFKTARTGFYTIEYTATDYYGNVGKETVVIECTEDVTTISAAPQGEYATTAKTGVTITPAEIAYEGGAGNVTTYATIKAEGGEEVLLDDNFKPEQAGVYTVTLYAVDMLGNQATYTYEVEVVANEAPVFLDDVVLPKFFLAGYSYTIPSLSAYDFSSGKVELSTVIAVKDGGEERVLTDGVGSFTPDDEGYATIIYKATGAKGSNQKEYKVPVVDTWSSPGSIDMTKYFYGENLTAVAEKDNIKISSTVDTEYHFINPVIADGFNMKFAITQNEFACLQLTFTDAKDDTRQFTVEIENSNNPDENALLKINGIATRERPGAGFYDGKVFSFYYDEYNKAVKEGALLSQLIKDEDGNLFEGFSSNLMYVSVKVIGVKGTAELSWKNFGGQAMSFMDMDMIKPLIAVSKDYDSTYTYKSVCEIYPAISADVLSPETTNSVTVYDPNNNIVTDVNGLLLYEVPFDQSYFIQLDQYGSYSVVYTSKDRSGRTQTYYEALYVADVEAPVISLRGEVQTQVKLGEKIKIVKAFAVDNLDENVVTYTYLLNPSGVITSVENGGSVVATQTGVYEIRYMSIDAFGNLRMLTYKVTVV